MASDLYRKCEACGGSRFLGEGKFADPYSLCPSCKGEGYVSVAPAPTDTLRAAAQAVLDDFEKADVRQEIGSEFVSISISLLDALRAALDAPPVALTEADETALADAIRFGMQANAIRPEFAALDNLIAALEERGYAIVRRTS